MWLVWTARTFIIFAWISAICKFVKEVKKGVNKDKIVMAVCIIELVLGYTVMMITFQLN